MESLIASKLLGSGGGGGGSTLISKTITRNGDYNASDDEADGYSNVKVNVSPSLLNKTIKSNGTYKADAFNVDGFGNIVVDVSDISTDTIAITATENGTYTGGPNIQYTVPLPSTIEPKTDTQIEMPKGVFNDFNRLTISYTNTTSGDSGVFTMKPSDVVAAMYPQSIESRTMVVNNDNDNFIFISKLESTNNDIIIIYLAGFTIDSIKFNKYAPLIESVEVDVEPNVIEKTITENGTYNAVDDEADGYSSVIINVAGSGGETKYYEYIRALNGQVIVRVEYPDAERTYASKTLWFFNGFYTNGGDQTIPANLFPYLPIGWSSDVMMTSGYSDSTSETQIGWIGFVYPNYRDPSYTKFRTWTENKGSTLAGTFWGVLDISGEETQITEWFDPYENVPPSQIKNYGGTIEDGYNINTNLKALGNVYSDSAMSYTIDDNSFDITWNESGGYIGFSFNGDVDLKASDIQRLSYKINFGDCYDNANNQNIRPFIIGVTDTIRTTPSTGVYFDPSQVDDYFTKYKMYYKDVCNTTVEDYVDISDIEGPCYLFIVATGWIASITDLSMISNCTPQIGTTLSQFNFFKRYVEAEGGHKITAVDADSFDVWWGNTPQIGHCLNGQIPLTGKNRLDIDIDYVGDNYQHANNNRTRNFNLAVVITDILVDGYVNLDNLESQGHILAIKEWCGVDIYGQGVHDSIDLSNIEGPYYINYQIPGYNLNGFRARLYSVNAILPQPTKPNLVKGKIGQASPESYVGEVPLDIPLIIGKWYVLSIQDMYGRYAAQQTASCCFQFKQEEQTISIPLAGSSGPGELTGTLVLKSNSISLTSYPDNWRDIYAKIIPLSDSYQFVN